VNTEEEVIISWPHKGFDFISNQNLLWSCELDDDGRLVKIKDEVIDWFGMDSLVIDGEKSIKFALEGWATKAFYVKMYYKSGGDVQQIYPLDTWRSSLFEYSFDNFTIPGQEQHYTITEDIFTSLYIFMALEDIDENDFSQVVKESEDIIDLLRSQEFRFSRQVVWDNSSTQFTARLYEGDIVPLILDLQFK
jgi:hypothetical protein